MYKRNHGIICNLAFKIQYSASQWRRRSRALKRDIVYGRASEYFPHMPPKIAAQTERNCSIFFCENASESPWRGLVQLSCFRSLLSSKERTMQRLPLTRRSSFQSWPKGVLKKEGLPETSSTRKLIPINGNIERKRSALDVLSAEICTPNMAVELLDHWNDEYEEVIINSESPPSFTNAFASALPASLFPWRLKGKKGVWLKLLTDQAELVPVAINVR